MLKTEEREKKVRLGLKIRTSYQTNIPRNDKTTEQKCN